MTPGIPERKNGQEQAPENRAFNGNYFQDIFGKWLPCAEFTMISGQRLGYDAPGSHGLKLQVLILSALLVTGRHYVQYAHSYV